MTPQKIILKQPLSWFYSIQGKQVMQRGEEYDEFVWNEAKGRYESESGLKMSLSTYEFHKNKFKAV